MTMWHHTHLGSLAVRGVGLVLTEATSVCPEGRISPQDLGLWEDGQTESLRQMVEFSHSQSIKMGVQLGHAGRKASTVAPWVDRKAAAGSFVSLNENVILSCTFACDSSNPPGVEEGSHQG